MLKAEDDDTCFLLAHDDCFVQQKRLLPLDSVAIEYPVKDEKNYGNKFCSLLDDIFGSSEPNDLSGVVKRPPSTCGFSSISNNSKENVQISSSGERYKCSNCPKSFAQQWPKIYHQRVCLGEVTHTCSECNKGYGTAQGLKIHKNIHDVDRRFKCLECGKIFPLKRVLDKHMRLHRGEKPFKCHECEKSFGSSGNLRDHNLTHHSSERPFPCQRCNKSFKFSGSLKLHMRAHNNERPFQCEICEKSFHNTSNLKRHSKIHAAIRSLDFKCRHCDQSFLNAGTRKCHELRKHGGEKKHVCSFCEKGFVLKSYLTRHMQCHANERKFKCPESGCSFASNWREGISLHHKHIHLGLRPHSCPTCQKSFKTKTHLKSHQNTHTI